MIETKWQALAASTINDRGGFAKKLSNLFLVGVPDLLVQVKGFPTWIVEAKRAERLQPIDGSRLIVLDVTGPQSRFLTEHREAGGRGGVLSVVEIRNGKGATTE